MYILIVWAKGKIFKSVMEMEREDVKSLLKLANISLTEEEAEAFSQNLGSMVDFIKVVEDWDMPRETEELTFRTPLREDEVRASLPSHHILSNAEESRDGFFLVKEKG